MLKGIIGPTGVLSFHRMYLQHSIKNKNIKKSLPYNNGNNSEDGLIQALAEVHQGAAIWPHPSQHNPCRNIERKLSKAGILLENGTFHWLRTVKRFFYP